MSTKCFSLDVTKLDNLNQEQINKLNSVIKEDKFYGQDTLNGWEQYCDSEENVIVDAILTFSLINDKVHYIISGNTEYSGMGYPIELTCRKQQQVKVRLHCCSSRETEESYQLGEINVGVWELNVTNPDLIKFLDSLNIWLPKSPLQ